MFLCRPDRPVNIYWGFANLVKRLYQRSWSYGEDDKESKWFFNNGDNMENIDSQKIDVKGLNEKGASLVEYALLVALIAVVAITAVGTLGTKVSSQFNAIQSKLN